MFNKTPIDWFSKLQSTVESATFGSEYVAAKTCTEQVIAILWEGFHELISCGEYPAGSSSVGNIDAKTGAFALEEFVAIVHVIEIKPGPGDV
jgi:hypothetical protein